ncbi:protein unc-13 homolog isoform X5 [Typha latifolia]|uniref:protein unc-13 homolog isoform X5 n=1 Tax=Typha latifolia TaxID=4733 RepID=UPI003C2C9526
MEYPLLLEGYRRDRRKLLEFLLSAGLARSPLGNSIDLAGVDLDTISADYVLELIGSGGEFDPSEATRRYFDGLKYPIMKNSSSGNSFFFLSKPTYGCPPQRAAPHTGGEIAAKSTSNSIRKEEYLVDEDIGLSGNDSSIGVATIPESSQSIKDADTISLGLPALVTGLSDDDMRETAYEVLLASLVLGGEVHFLEEKKKEKKSRFLKGLMSKRDGLISQSQQENCYSDLLDTIRVQMEISETMHACIKQGFRLVGLRMTLEQIDIPFLLLELLSAICETDFPNERLHIQWRRRQANVLEELLMVSVNDDLNMQGTLKMFLSKLRSIKDQGLNVSGGFADILTIVKQYVSKLLRMPGKFGLQGESYFWTGSYHFNLKLYEKLLCSIFDILEDGQIIEEADEILGVLKLTWPILGIIQKIHDTLYAWVLFYQDKSIAFESVATLAVLCGVRFTDECKEIKYIGHMAGTLPESMLVHIFVEKSIQAAYRQAVSLSDSQSHVQLKHPLAILANELKLIAEKEHTLFNPVLRRLYPDSGRLAFILMHLLYGERLKPFLEEFSQLSENVKEVLTASNSLELCLVDKLYALYGNNMESFMINYLHPYQIKKFSGPLILQWIHAQHVSILQWTERAIEIEDWEPLSSQQRQAKSVVEVFRIVEETVDQFFSSNLPMDTIHLRSLLIGISQSLEVYVLHIVNQQVPKTTLFPSSPALTRYAESVNPFTRKKIYQPTTPEEKISIQLNNLTVRKLCVKLNTLYYVRDQLDNIEDAIKQSWALSLSGFTLLDCMSHTTNGQNVAAVYKSLSAQSESVDELFTVFDDVRRSAILASEKIFDFIGPRVIFWDVRESFLFSLYRGSVESARLEMFLPVIDQVLDCICDLIIDTLRDKVVLSICQAAMDGYIWVLLDGGPCRVFSERDVTLMQEDLAVLKDLFIANGQGLPCDTVEKEARLAQQILNLYTLKADTIIEMLMSASENVSCHPEPKTCTRCATDAETLLRVLCHKKDKSASNFLKLQYQLPKSSDYGDLDVKEPTSPVLSDILKRSTSFTWTQMGQRSFRMMRNKFQALE